MKRATIFKNREPHSGVNQASGRSVPTTLEEFFDENLRGHKALQAKYAPVPVDQDDRGEQ